MADLKLKSVQIRNWMKYGNVSLNFPEKGLVVVTGHNLASNGAMQSVGSGKTGFGEAICHALLGVSSHFDRVGSYSRDKKGDTYVCLEAIFLGKPLKIEMGYKCKELSTTGEALQYTYGGGKPISRGRVEQTRADLVKMLGVPQLLASWTVFVDGDNLKFNKLSQADSVELIMSALRQPPWSEYHERSKKALGTFKQAMAKDQVAHDNAHQNVADAERDIEDAEEEVSNQRTDYNQRKARNDIILKDYQTKIDAQTRQVEFYQSARTHVSNRIDELIQTNAAESHRLEIQRNAINDQIHALKEKSRPMVREHDIKCSTCAIAGEAHKNYKNSGKVCPTCKRPTNTPIDPVRLQELADAEAKAKAVVDIIDADYEALQTKIEEQEKLLRANQKETAALGVQQAVSKLSDEDAKLEGKINEAQTIVHQLEIALTKAKAGVTDTELKKAEATLTERQRILKQLKHVVETRTKELADSRVMLQALEYWNMAFSPYGIPNMVLRDAIAPLNKEAKRLSTVMTGGTIEISYSTQREMASGMEKAQLVVDVDNKLGSSDMRGNSKGEAGLTNFIISETLSEVGQVPRRLGFKWLDEILPNQDPVICKAIYQYLRQMSNKLGILIFIVTHDPNAANYADHELIIEKTNSEGGVVGNAYFQP